MRWKRISAICDHQVMVPQKLRGWDMESLIAFIYRRDLHKVLTLGSVIGNPLSILNPSLIWREREREYN